MVKLCLRYKSPECIMCIILVVISLMSLFLNRPSKKNGHFKLHPCGSLWGVSLNSAASLVRCCAYPVLLLTVEVLLKSELTSNTAELSGILSCMFLLCCLCLV